MFNLVIGVTYFIYVKPDNGWYVSGCIHNPTTSVGNIYNLD